MSGRGKFFTPKATNSPTVDKQDNTPLASAETQGGTYGSAENVDSAVALVIPEAKDESVLREQAQIRKTVFTQIQRWLESDSAQINNISIGIPAALNAVMSTYPDNFNNSRLKVVTGLELFIYASLSVAFLYKHIYKNEAPAQFKKFIQYASVASNGFSFPFQLGCKVAANILSAKKVPNNAPVDAGVTTLIALSLGGGALECLAFSKPEDSNLRKYLNKWLFSVALGNVVGDLFRIYNFAPNNNYHPDELEKVASWSPLVTMGLGLMSMMICSLPNNRTGQNMANMLNMLYDVGTLLECITLNDDVALSLIATKMLFFVMLQCVKQFSLKPVDENSQEENLLPTDDIESAQDSVTNNSPRQSR
jgi:hypothetical protein